MNPKIDFEFHEHLMNTEQKGSFCQKKLPCIQMMTAVPFQSLKWKTEFNYEIYEQFSAIYFI